MGRFVRRWGSHVIWGFGVVAAIVGLLAYGDQVGRWYLSGYLSGYALAADVGKIEQRQKAIEDKVDTLTSVVLEGRLAEVQGKISTLVGRRNLSPAEVEYLHLLRGQERSLKAQLRRAP